MNREAASLLMLSGPPWHQPRRLGFALNPGDGWSGQSWRPNAALGRWRSNRRAHASLGPAEITFWIQSTRMRSKDSGNERLLLRRSTGDGRRKDSQSTSQCSRVKSPVFNVLASPVSLLWRRGHGNRLAFGPRLPPNHIVARLSGVLQRLASV